MVYIEEIWKEIDLGRITKYKYYVSNFGNFKRVYEGHIDNRGRIYPSYEVAIAKNYNKKNGYYNVSLSGKKYYVHRIVAKYFCEGYSEELEVNHKDGDKSNNKAENLEWVTRVENVEHAKSNGLINRTSEKRKQACRENQKKSIEANYKRVVQISTNGEVIKIYNSIKEASEKTGIDDSNISRSTRTKYLAGGYNWILFTDFIKN